MVRRCALTAMGATSGGYPYFVQAYGKAAWDHAPGSPITAADVAVAAPEAEAELAVGFFGSRYERATPAERDYLRAMAGLTTELAPDAAVSTTDVADVLGRKPSFAVTGPGCAAEEGPGLFRRARHLGLYRSALRPLVADPPAGLTGNRFRSARWTASGCGSAAVIASSTMRRAASGPAPRTDLVGLSPSRSRASMSSIASRSSSSPSAMSVLRTLSGAAVW